MRASIFAAVLVALFVAAPAVAQDEPTSAPTSQPTSQPTSEPTSEPSEEALYEESVLLGTWAADMSTFQFDWEALGIPEDQVEMVREMILAGEMEITFEEGYRYSARDVNPTNNEETIETGDYSVESIEGSTMTVILVEDGDADGEDDPGSLVFTGPDSFTLSIEDEVDGQFAVKFDRVVAE